MKINIIEREAKKKTKTSSNNLFKAAKRSVISSFMGIPFENVQCFGNVNDYLYTP